MNNKNIILIEYNPNEPLFINTFSNGNLLVKKIDGNTDIKSENLDTSIGGIKVYENNVRIVYGNMDSYLFCEPYVQSIQQNIDIPKKNNKNFVKYKFIDETYSVGARNFNKL